MIRKPAVAGFFYSDDPGQLNQDLDGYLRLEESAVPSKALGVISPHAGYIYSGGVAGKLFATTELTDQFIVLCPKHYAEGDDAAIISAGHWDTPLGSYPINTDLALKLMSAINILEEDPQAHAKEHSLEVQIPFLQKLKPQASFVPIALGPLSWEEICVVGHGIAKVLMEMPAHKRPLIIASSDMNHYEDEETTQRKDEEALACIRQMDPHALLSTCRNQNISMCGVIPSTAMLIATKALGASQANVLEHTTSAATSGDTARVVGYASVQVH